ncbi:Frataxin-like protein [Cladobotryum mycophilum]|uniref:ferroxidase n=1 Tax=Cladobotryum mycophilum TaxID=491253 RepID=A0ABR0SYE4_9HYPO
MASFAVSRQGIAQASRFIPRAARNTIATRANLKIVPTAFRAAYPPVAAPQRAFSSCARLYKGIMPDTSTPTTKDSPTPETKYVVAELTDEEYHEISDNYLDNALAKFEQLQESREDLDVEYSAGVMTITVADKGTYVINKQPPNKQIWLSSPISGPKRYDWSVVSEGQGDKEGTAIGFWVYSRDGSTLDALVLGEIGVDITGPVDS